MDGWVVTWLLGTWFLATCAVGSFAVLVLRGGAMRRAPTPPPVAPTHPARSPLRSSTR